MLLAVLSNLIANASDLSSKIGLVSGQYTHKICTGTGLPWECASRGVPYGVAMDTLT